MSWWESFKLMCAVCPVCVVWSLFWLLFALSFWLCVARPEERMNMELSREIDELRKRLGMDDDKKTE